MYYFNVTILHVSLRIDYMPFLLRLSNYPFAGVFIIRNDDFLEDLDLAEMRCFVCDDLIPKPVRVVTQKLLNRYPVSI